MIFSEHQLAHRYLDGLTGLEIGAAAHNPFGLNSRNVAPIDDFEFYASDQVQHGLLPVPVDLWGTADAIPVADGSEDFVLSSHVIEHLPNPIAAFMEWNRVLRVGGIVFLIAPLRDALPADRNRDITTLEHLIEDYQAGHTIDTHPIDGVPGGRMGHYHVFTPDLLIRAVEWMRQEKLIDWELLDSEEIDTKVGNGFTLVFRVVEKAGITAPHIASSISLLREEPIRQYEIRSLRNQIPLTPAAAEKSFCVGIVGTFEVANYGDLLFPAILSRVASKRIPGFIAKLYSPAAGRFAFDDSSVNSIQQLMQDAKDLDAIVFGGGDIARFDPAGWVSGPERMTGYSDLVIQSAMAAHDAGIPFAWNAPGVSPGISQAQSEILAEVVHLSEYATVRDPASAKTLVTAGATVDVVPDTGFLVAEMFPRSELGSVFTDLQNELKLPRQYRTIHLSPATTDLADASTAAAALAQSYARDGIPILLLPLGPMHGEVEVLEAMAARHPQVLRCLPGDLHPLEWMAILAHSETHIGSGLHGNITAYAYDVPVVVVDRFNLAKLAEFARLSKMPLLAGWDELKLVVDAALKAVNPTVREGIANAAREHLHRMLESLNKPAKRKAISPLTQAMTRWASRTDHETGRAAEMLNRIAQSSAHTKEQLIRKSSQLTSTQNEIKRLTAEVSELRLELKVREGAVQECANMRDAIRADRETLGQQTLHRLRRARDTVFPDQTIARQVYRGLRKPLVWAFRIPNAFRWSSRSIINTARQVLTRRRVQALPVQPLVSILTPVYNVAEVWLQKAVASVQQQSYPNWELCLVNDDSTSPHIRRMLDRLVQSDSRIRVLHRTENGGIVAASADALDMARGEFIGLLDHDDELAPDALLEIITRAVEDPTIDLVYTDEDKIDPHGHRFDPVRKPAWNPGLLLSCNYITHFSVFRAELLRACGGFRPGYDGSQDYDLLLRATEKARRIVHIPEVLYHWRVIETSTAGCATAKPYAYTAAVRALEDARSRRGLTGSIEIKTPGLYRLQPQSNELPRVTLIFTGGSNHSESMSYLDQLLEGTAYPHLEIVVLAAGVSPLETKIRQIPVRFQPAERCGTFEIGNVIRLTKTPFVAVVSTPIRPVRPGWLSAMAVEMSRPDVGVVGAKILGPDGRVCHTGWTIDRDGNPKSTSDFLSSASIVKTIFTDVSRDCLAVGGGCVLIRREAFDAVELLWNFELTHADVALGIQLAYAGWANVYTPEAVLQRLKPLNSSQHSPKFAAWLHEHKPASDSLFPPVIARSAVATRAA